MKKIIFLLICIIVSLQGIGQVKNKCLRFSEDNNNGLILNERANKAKSIDFWFKIDKWNKKSQIIASEFNNSKKILLSLNDLNLLSLSVFNDENVSLAYKIEADIKINNWYHCYVSFDDSTQNPVVFIDKSRVEIYSYTSEQILFESIALGANKFCGSIDELRFWNRTFTATSIYYDQSISKYIADYSSLVAYYKFDSYPIKEEISAHTTIPNSKLDIIAYNDNLNFKYRIISGYLRSKYFKLNEISDSYILRNNDIIYFALRPYADGRIHWDYADNDAVLRQVDYLNSYKGRKGVLNFKGKKSLASINNAYDLLAHDTKNPVSQFSFECDIYIQKWTKDTKLFESSASNNSGISIKLGRKSKGELIFSFDDNDFKYRVSTSLIKDKWQHLSFIFNLDSKDQIQIFIDGAKVKTDFAQRVDRFNTQFESLLLFSGFNGMVDQLKIWNSSPSKYKTYKDDSIYEIDEWNDTKLKMYWPINNSDYPTSDFMSWKTDIKKLRFLLNDKKGIKLRLGIASGNWKVMVKDSIARRKFISSLNHIVLTENLDGIDIDFEWAYNKIEWANYNKFLFELASSIKKELCFSITIHPLFYKIDKKNIDLSDFISVQSYGPSSDRFPYKEFRKNIIDIIKYGVPASKLVMGLPFYATTADGSRKVVSYRDIISQNKNISKHSDFVNYSFPFGEKRMILNGQSTIAKKCRLIKIMSLAGVMYWDMYTDVDLINDKCLMKSLNKEISTNITN